MKQSKEIRLIDCIFKYFYLLIKSYSFQWQICVNCFIFYIFVRYENDCSLD